MKKFIFCLLLSGVCILLDANSNRENSYENFVVEKAIQNGDLEKVQYCMQHTTDMKLKNKWLEDALFFGDLSIIRYAIECGADVNTQAVDTGAAALMLRMDDEDALDLITCLVEHGANVNLRDNDGSTTLMCLHDDISLDLIRYLVEHGADVNAQDNGGYTPLYSAVLIGRLDIVQYLVERGANINVESEDGETILSECRNKKITQYLEGVLKKKGIKPLYPSLSEDERDQKKLQNLRLESERLSQEWQSKINK